MNAFLLGALMMAYIVAAMFFVQYWRRTSDRFFAMFAVGFGVLAANQVAFLIWGEDEERSLLYLIRLIAYGCILVAIVDKNRSAE